LAVLKAQLAQAANANQQAPVKMVANKVVVAGDEEKGAPVAQVVPANAQQQAGIPIPLVAKGFEAIYQRFFNGVLVYRPNPDNDAGMIKLPIAALRNPLEDTFDLSQCGDTGKYLSISTGYRRQVNPANANKVEIWFAPKFLIDKYINSTAGHFKA